MACRAVHIEVTFSLDTDFFILALRRLVARRGNRSIYSDNGSNFIGAEQELKKAYMEMDDRKIRRWHKNPLLASHNGWSLGATDSLSKSHSGITLENTWRVPG